MPSKNTTKPSSELLPCPFCGATAELRDDGDGVTMDGDQPYWIACRDCQASVSHFYEAEDAIEEWNLRT